MFWMMKHGVKGKYYVFNGYEKRKKVGFVNLQYKLQHDRYRWSIFCLKCQKTVERTYPETEK